MNENKSRNNDDFAPVIWSHSQGAFSLRPSTGWDFPMPSFSPVLIVLMLWPDQDPWSAPRQQRQGAYQTVISLVVENCS